MAGITARSKLGDFFVAFRLATRRQIKDALSEVRPTEMLGQVLVRAGVCDVSLCNRVADVQARYRRAAGKLRQEGVEIALDEKTFIGDIMVALGMVSLQVKNDCLRQQEEERAAGGKPPRLGEMLIERAGVPAEDRDMAMQVQDWLRGVR